MVTGINKEQWSPASWPVSFRWRLLAALAVLVATAVAIFALSGGSDAMAKVPVVAALQRWPAGHPPGDHIVVSVPAELAAYFVHPADLEGAVAAVDVPEGTLVSATMLRPAAGSDDARTTALLQFTVNADLWPDPGPAAGSQAVFSTSSGGCATAQATLVAVAGGGAAARVTVEADPGLAAALADGPWWIWESPPGGWPQCPPGGSS